MKRLLNWLFGNKPQQDNGPAALKNRPGEMAWVKSFGHEHGADAMAGTAVRTVAVTHGRFWTIDPPLHYLVGPMAVACTASGVTALPGQIVRVTAIANECLEPWREIGDADRCESERWLPPVPVGLPTIADTRIPTAGGEGA